MENYFKRENIFLDFDANDRKDFLSKISKILFEKKYVKEGFDDSIIEREEQYPTGLDFGEYKIAIPHTNPEYVNEEGIITVKLKKPIIFRDMGLDICVTGTKRGRTGKSINKINVFTGTERSL